MKSRRIIIVCAVVVVCFAIYGVAVGLTYGGITNAGVFGDMFGGFNALFAALGAIGVVIAIFIQQEQLELQRTELSLQREELKLQREEMAKSRAELAAQARVQNSSLLATIVQLKIESLNCGNLADEIESQRNNPGAREIWITKIRMREEAMKKLITELESEIRKTEG